MNSLFFWFVYFTLVAVNKVKAVFAKVQVAGKKAAKEKCLRPVRTYLNIELTIELECCVLRLHKFYLNQNETFLFDIELNIEGLKACSN